VRNGLEPIPLRLAGVDVGDAAAVAAALDAAAAAAAAAGHPIRALLFANPSNPEGTVFRRPLLLALLRWCLARGVHAVSDEIYGNSVFGGADAGFVSAATVVHEEVAAGRMDRGAADGLIHIIFGLSKARDRAGWLQTPQRSAAALSLSLSLPTRPPSPAKPLPKLRSQDFCASGLRMGCLLSRNAQLNTALGNLGYFACCSNHTQARFAAAPGSGGGGCNGRRRPRLGAARSLARCPLALSSPPNPSAS
jgi:1-aminocyclopropane-1-carboxylate synthase